MIEVVGLDGDDTLWHNEGIFTMTQARFTELLAPWIGPEELAGRLLDTERRNLAVFGYGIKGFVLSMIETAVEVSDGAVTGRQVGALLDFGRDMLAHPVEVLEGVCDALDELAGRYRLVLVTKGDLFDQESKLARSGLGDRFERVEVVSEKDGPTYRRVMQRAGVGPEGFVMVGNSLRSDVLPVVALGARAVHVPYTVTWEHERVELPDGLPPGAAVVSDLGALPALLTQLDGRPGPSGPAH